MPPYNIQKSTNEPHKLQNMDNTPNVVDEGDGLRANLSHEELIHHNTNVEGGNQSLLGDCGEGTVVVVPRQSSALKRTSPDGEGGGGPEGADGTDQRRFTKLQLVTVSILCYVNLINYMDRFTVAGILIDIQNSFDITESQCGLLQTAFVLVYMIFAPLFGYLGDRYSRKILMAIGIFFWSLSTLIGSFMPDYHLFLLFRCIVGVGEASYSTLAPTIISDLFVKDQRSKMLALFYFAIPVGSGLGYIIGSEVKNLVANAALLAGTDHTEAWRYGLRVTPVFGLIALILIIFAIKEPPRGESEGGQHLQATSFLNDLKYLFTNKSFVFSTIAFTCVTFVAGALAWWGPLFTAKGVKIQPHPNSSEDSVSLIFGAIAMSAGIIGVPLGSILSQKLRVKLPFADPLVCGVGLFFSCPLLIGAMVLAQTNTLASYAVVFFAQLFLNLNWAIVSDIVLYVVIPTRRSSAAAFQILFSHAFGDAGSPYLIGVVAEQFKPYITPRNETVTTTTALPILNTTLAMDYNDTEVFDTTITTTEPPNPNDEYLTFKSLQYSMFLCASVNLIGAVFFFINSCFVRKDKERCDRTIAEFKFSYLNGKVPSNYDERVPLARGGDEADDEGSTSSSRSLTTPEDPDPELEQTQNLLT